MAASENEIPQALRTYMYGLKMRDIDAIRSTFADDLRFVTPFKTMESVQVIEFLAALYRGFPDWSYKNEEPERIEEGVYRVKWYQGGTHTGRLAFPGFAGVEATGKTVTIPPHYFYYRIREGALVEIRPDPVPGGAPRGIFEQIGVALPPL